MRYIVMLIVLILLGVCQSSILPFVRLYSGQPNLTLLVVSAWAIRSNWDEAILWAFVGGILQDIGSIAPLGTSVVPILLAIFAIKLSITQIEGLAIFIYGFFVVVALLVGQIILFITLGLVGYPIDLVPTIRYFLLPSLVYQLVLALPVYGVTRFVQYTIPESRSLR